MGMREIIRERERKRERELYRTLRGRNINREDIGLESIIIPNVTINNNLSTAAFLQLASPSLFLFPTFNNLLLSRR